MFRHGTWTVGSSFTLSMKSPFYPYAVLFEGLQEMIITASDVISLQHIWYIENDEGYFDAHLC